ncbi:MAG: VWA domain-containing protein [Magnetococcus sp. WYHC-3]
MMALDWPWALLALPLPWLAWRGLRPRAEAPIPALRVPFLAELAQNAPRHRGQPAQRRSGLRLGTALLAWLLLVSAAARPQWLGPPLAQPLSGRDLMMAVDLSNSMDSPDFELNGQPANRLDAVKRVASAFIRNRPGDRIGLILFGDQAYLQAPLTLDRETVAALLDEAAIGLAGQNTAIGDAIALALKRLEDSGAREKVLILLTDGRNTAGATAPRESAKVAIQRGLRIHAIGVGATEMQVPGLFGLRRVNPSADLDETLLKELAQQSGGRYFRATDTNTLTEIYAELDRLEPVPRDQRLIRPHVDLFFWPLGGALVLAVALLLPAALAGVPWPRFRRKTVERPS